jgi:hypothetical protein
MKPGLKPGLAVGAVAALLVGGVALATSRNSSNSAAPVTPVPQQAAVQPLPNTAFDASAGTTIAVPVETFAPVRERVVYGDRVVDNQRPARTVRTARRARVVTTTRSGKKSALIIGGSAAGGAITGALIGGKKGAVIGGLIGGAGGTVYDRKTRKKRRVVYQ